MKFIRYFVLCMILGATASAHALVIGGSTGGALTSKVYLQPKIQLTNLHVVYEDATKFSGAQRPAAYALDQHFTQAVQAAFAPYRVKTKVVLFDAHRVAHVLRDTTKRGIPVLLIRDTGKFLKEGTDLPSRMNTLKLDAALYERHEKRVWSGTAQASFWGRKSVPQDNPIRRILPLALAPQGSTINMREAVLTNVVQQIAADLSRHGFIPPAAAGTPASASMTNPSPNTGAPASATSTPAS
jgi:hypothetical protein